MAMSRQAKHLHAFGPFRIEAAERLLLRKALGDDLAEHRYIETVARRGYRFIAEVVGRSKAGVSEKNLHSWQEVERYKDGRRSDRVVKSQSGCIIMPEPEDSIIMNRCGGQNPNNRINRSRAK